MAQGKILGNLYVLHNDSLFLHFSCNDKIPMIPKVLNIQSCNSVRHLNKDYFSIWHQRLGHSSTFVLEHLNFISSKLHDESFPCIPFHEAKQQRFPFQNSESHSDDIFKLIHVDLWGLYKTKTITGASYFLTIVDDNSRAICTFLLNDRIPVFQTFSKKICLCF